MTRKPGRPNATVLTTGRRKKAHVGLDHSFADAADLSYSVQAPRSATHKKSIPATRAICPEKARAVEEILGRLSPSSPGTPVPATLEVPDSPPG